MASSLEDIQNQYPNSLIEPVEITLDRAREKHFDKFIMKLLDHSN